MHCICAVHDSRKWHPLHPSHQNATVGALRRSIVASFGLTDFCLVHDASGDTVVLANDEEHLHICLTGPGPVLVDPNAGVAGDGEFLCNPLETSRGGEAKQKRELN